MSMHVEEPDAFVHDQTVVYVKIGTLLYPLFQVFPVLAHDVIQNES